MCLAIFSRPNARPPKEALLNGFENNKDGAGYAYAYEGKLILKKGFFSFDEFWNSFKAIPDGVPILIHFRKATHGPKNAENCHPWQINEHHAMIHNGILRQHEESDTACSDTGRFVEKILRPVFYKDPLCRDWAEPWMHDLLENYIGTGNKMVILSSTGEFSLFRSEHGMWENDCWYSNDTFKRKSIWGWGYEGEKKNPSSLSETSLPITLSLDKIDKILEKKENERKGFSTTKKKAKFEQIFIPVIINSASAAIPVSPQSAATTDTTIKVGTCTSATNRDFRIVQQEPFRPLDYGLREGVRLPLLPPKYPKIKPIKKTGKKIHITEYADRLINKTEKKINDFFNHGAE